LSEASGLLDRVIDRVGDRALYWFGTRGTDAQPLLSLPQFSGVYSMVAPLETRADDVSQCCLESLTNRRVDLNAYSIDDDRGEHVGRLYKAMTQSIVRPTVVTAYRPSDFLASVCYPREDLLEYAGMFHARQSAFEHKSWVERELARIGVRTIPWTYYADYARTDMESDIRRSRHEYSVIRANASDGGRGLSLVHREDQHIRVPDHSDHFIAAAPYLDPSTPLNIGGCVYADGAVSLHGPSIQLIGVTDCVEGRFAYCGNDFAAVSDALGDDGIEEFEALTLQVGAWLSRQGFVGAFGLDALLFEGKLHLTEVNPRFQGSSSASADLDESLDRDSIYTHHLAASLGEH
jgi:hypothetical protein